MNWRYVIAALIGLVGLIFLGQGLGIIPGSAMSGSSFWAVVGVVLLIGAAVIVWWTRRPATR